MYPVSCHKEVFDKDNVVDYSASIDTTKVDLVFQENSCYILLLAVQLPMITLNPLKLNIALGGTATSKIYC